MRIAHFSPLPPQQSGIADYCAALLPYLAQHVAIDAFIDSDDLSAAHYALRNMPALSTENQDLGYGIRPLSDFLQSPQLRAEYDLCLYHMGNAPTFHEKLYTTLLRYPGITLLHEINLHAFHLNRTLTVNRDAAYIREMGYAGGLVGVAQARALLAGEQLNLADYPLFERIVDISLSIIVHTEFAKQIVLHKRPAAKVTHIPHAVKLPILTETAVRPALISHLSPHTVLLGTFGFIAPSKRIEIVLAALAKLRHNLPDFHYVIVGKPISGYALELLIDELNLNDVVTMTGFVDDRTFQTYLSAVDIGINLRTGPTGGEMSGTLVRLMAHACPTLVSDVGGFAAFPDESVIKIKQDATEEQQLVDILTSLLTDGDMRQKYGQAARAYVQKTQSFEEVSQQIVTFMGHRHVLGDTKV